MVNAVYGRYKGRLNKLRSLINFDALVKFHNSQTSGAAASGSTHGSSAHPVAPVVPALGSTDSSSSSHAVSNAAAAGLSPRPAENLPIVAATLVARTSTPRTSAPTGAAGPNAAQPRKRKLPAKATTTHAGHHQDHPPTKRASNDADADARVAAQRAADMARRAAETAAEAEEAKRAYEAAMKMAQAAAAQAQRAREEASRQQRP